MTLSAVSLAFFGLFAKLGTQEVSFIFLMFVRFLAPFLLLLPFFIWQGTFQHISLKMHRNQILRPICVLVSQYCIFYYLTQGTLLNASVLLNSGPFFVPILQSLFYGQKISKQTYISIFIALLGVICILQPGKDLFSVLSLIGLLAGLGHALSQLLYGKNAQHERGDVNLFNLFFLGTLFSFLPVLVENIIYKHNIKLVAMHMVHEGWPLFYLALLSIATIANQVFRGLAYTKGSPALLAPFLYIAVLISALLDWLVFNNPPNALSAIGALLVLFGGALQIYAKLQRLKKELG